MREIILTPDLSNSGNFEQLWFLWQKSPPPHSQHEGKFFDTRSIHFRQFWATLIFMAEKSPLPPRDEGNFFDTRSIHFRQFWATLVFVAEKPPLQDKRKFFGHQIYPFQAILSKFSLISGGCFSATKIKVARNCLKLFISWIFEQLWFLWQKSLPPPPFKDEGKFFDIRSIQFRQFWATLIFVAEKPPPPRMRENFLTPDLSISGNFEQLWFCGRKAPPRMRENFLTPDISISGNFEQLWFCGRKSPPPTDEGNSFDTRSIQFRQFRVTLVFAGRKAPPSAWGKNFWHQIYSFHEFLSNFGFCGRKATPTQDEGKIFDIRSIHFRQFWATLVLWQKSPPSPQMREIFLTPDLSISGNFEQLWFVWQKSHPPHSQDEGKFFDTRSIHFRQFWATLVFVAEKPPPHSQDEGEFLTPDLSISGNFEQLWFCGRIVPPPHRMRENFWHQIYPIQAILSNFGFVAEKPPPQDEGKFFDTRSIHFR